jgi:hypothetical protein
VSIFYGDIQSLLALGIGGGIGAVSFGAAESVLEIALLGVLTHLLLLVAARRGVVARRWIVVNLWLVATLGFVFVLLLVAAATAPGSVVIFAIPVLVVGTAAQQAFWLWALWAAVQPRGPEAGASAV